MMFAGWMSVAVVPKKWGILSVEVKFWLLQKSWL